jgi:hypothetical protein
MNNSSEMTFDDLQRQLAAHTGAEAEPIRVFTIAYGKGATADILDKIADSSGGKAFTGDTASIGDVYQQISSFF